MTNKAYEAFLEDCKRRLVAAAPSECVFGGPYNGQGSYSHILKDPEQRYLLLQDKRLRKPDVCTSLFGGKLAFHEFSHHANSSQMFCLNVFGPLLIGEGRKRLLKAFLLGMGIELKGRVVFADEESCGTRFEYVTNVKGDRTNFDFYVKTDAGEEVFFEIKYTECEFGSPGRGSRSAKEWTFYRGLCERSRYLAKMVDSPDLFYAHFQVNRNIGHIVQKGDQSVVFLFPYSNPALQLDFPYKECARMKKVHVVFSEQLAEIAEKAFVENRKMQDYYRQLVRCYFNF